jgi:hypothetical protein
MRQKILNWNRKKGGNHWKHFLKFFETSPVTDEEYDFILKKEDENGNKNFISHSESHFNPVRKCLNSIYNKDKFVEQDLKKNLKEIDEDFLSGEKINFKDFLTRIEKYPMSILTLETLINRPNTTVEYNEKTNPNVIKQSKTILGIANKLHQQEKLSFSVDKVVSDQTTEGTPVDGFPLYFTWQNIWQPVFDLQEKIIKEDISRAKSEGKIVIYMSLPVSTEAGGFQGTNVEIANFTQQRLSDEWGDRFFFLNPSKYQLHSQTGYSQLTQHIEYLKLTGIANLPQMNSTGEYQPIPSGGSYMYMWTRVLVTNDEVKQEPYIDYEGQVSYREIPMNLGFDFDGVYFLGPTDVQKFFGGNNRTYSMTAQVEDYFARKLATDSRFGAFYNAGSTSVPSQEVEQARQNARREFVRYFVLRASSNFATGCHDEWNIFQLLNALRFDRTKNTGEQLAMYFDGRQVSLGATTIRITPGFSNKPVS